MTTPPPLDTVRDTRPEVLRDLRKLLGIVEQLDSTRKVSDRLTERRNAIWERLVEMDPPVRWADVARVSHVDSVTIIQTMKRRREAREKV